jgi:hypothetical protein
MGWCRGDRGQVAPLLVVLVLLVGVVALLLGRLGGQAVARAQARTAADAAALAGAAEGRAAAEAVASANGGRLESFKTEGTDTEVIIVVGTARATATARASGGDGAGGSGPTAGLAPAMLAAVARAQQVLGEPVPIVSGFRTYEQQAALWAHRATNPYPVARPGTSMHERGLAIDVASDFVDDLSAVAPQTGLCQPMPLADPVHFEPCPASHNL